MISKELFLNKLQFFNFVHTVQQTKYKYNTNVVLAQTLLKFWTNSNIKRQLQRKANFVYFMKLNVYCAINHSLEFLKVKKCVFGNKICYFITFYVVVYKDTKTCIIVLKISKVYLCNFLLQLTIFCIRKLISNFLQLHNSCNAVQWISNTWEMVFFTILIVLLKQ